MTDIEKAEKNIKSKTLFDFMNHLLKSGAIKDSDLNNNDILDKKIKKYLNDNEGNLDFVIITDHREDLLDVVEKFNGKHQELSISLYATFIEHTLNKIIHLVCQSKDIDLKTTIEIIKNVNISGKCTWLLKVLGLPSFKREYVNLILKISEERNSFIHYKWKPTPDDKVVDNEMSLKIQMLIKYLKNYESKVDYKGNKNKIIKIVKSKTKK